MKKALNEAKQQGAKGLILDLRNNPGGLVNELVDIAGEFLPANSTVLLEQNRSGERTPYKTQGAPVAPDLPLAVLVNHNTASSAEILAAALKENNRATVIGVPTFGTATVLRAFSLGGGAELRLGTTQWLTPNGEIVRNKGIDPSKVVELPANVTPLSPVDAAQLSATQLQQSDDTQLSAAYTTVETAISGKPVAHH
jgi:carboxyl-terminal processing protease